MSFSLYLETFILPGALCMVGLGTLAALAQQRPLPPRPGAASAQGELTVTLTVVSSVGIVMDENGEPRLIVANAADPADNVSSIRRVRLTPVQPVSAKPKDKKRGKER